jgi:hypothetical protein
MEREKAEGGGESADKENASQTPAKANPSNPTGSTGGSHKRKAGTLGGGDSGTPVKKSKTSGQSLAVGGDLSRRSASAEESEELDDDEEGDDDG